MSHRSDIMSDVLAKLAHNGKGTMARLTAKFAGLMCNKSFAMLRRLCDAAHCVLCL